MEPYGSASVVGFLRGSFPYVFMNLQFQDVSSSSGIKEPGHAVVTFPPLRQRVHGSGLPQGFVN